MSFGWTSVGRIQSKKTPVQEQGKDKATFRFPQTHTGVLLEMWEFNHHYMHDSYNGLLRGESLFNIVELAFALHHARLNAGLLEASASASCERHEMWHMFIRRIPGTTGFAVHEVQIRDMGKKLAEVFAHAGEVYIDIVVDSDVRCQVRAFDLLALRRHRCRPAVLPLLAMKVFPGLPRDMRVLLARLVWDTRHSESWASPDEDADAARIQFNAKHNDIELEWHYPVRCKGYHVLATYEDPSDEDAAAIRMEVDADRERVWVMDDDDDWEAPL